MFHYLLIHQLHALKKALHQHVVLAWHWNIVIKSDVISGGQSLWAEEDTGHRGSLPESTGSSPIIIRPTAPPNRMAGVLDNEDCRHVHCPELPRGLASTPKRTKDRLQGHRPELLRGPTSHLKRTARQRESPPNRRAVFSRGIQHKRRTAGRRGSLQEQPESSPRILWWGLKSPPKRTTGDRTTRIATMTVAQSCQRAHITTEEDHRTTRITIMTVARSCQEGLHQRRRGLLGNEDRHQNRRQVLPRSATPPRRTDGRRGSPQEQPVSSPRVLRRAQSTTEDDYRTSRIAAVHRGSPPYIEDRRPAPRFTPIIRMEKQKMVY
ncbi:hypothetical protein OUZ56_015449 [Daphnia magna]|uniref:Uncharacterized protein n=1 Tax=Daphnia magna TaxID=35525 RepID=A0ABR0AMV8_9CRUS|nr:hypothetical protein OUZ56_015449 [Daphnia magna]